MCGIAGILFKQQAGPIGDILIKMLADLNRRGPDSTGVALYGNLPKGNLVVRIKVDEDAQEETIDWDAGGEIQEPRGNHAAATPDFGHVGKVKVILVVFWIL